MSEMVHITINKQPLEVPAGTRIIEAAKMLNIDIPHLCYHPDQTIKAHCRMCMVEVVGSRKLTAACSTVVWEGMEVITDSKKVYDAQTGVKRVFGDKAIAAKLAERNIRLSSANSINWGRLVPQIVYYFAAYAQLLKAGKIAFGDEVDFCVPTGNFGDILAGYYAKQMGLPVGRLVCASNQNNVLTDFLSTGTYTAKREFYKTTSPSMDILVSSNLERLLYHVTGSDAEVAGLMKSLNETGSYTVRPETLAAIRESFDCGWSSEEQVAGEIRARYEKDGYLCDTHTAVAFHVAAQKKRDGVPMVVLSTASPFKFPRSVLEALGHTAPENDFEAMQALEEATGRTAPASLAALRQKAERFSTVIDPAGIAEVALGYQA